MERVKEFYQLAQNCCEAILGFDADSPVSIRTLLKNLLRVYVAALDLPAVEPQSDWLPEVQIPSQISISTGNDTYWEVFDPYHMDSDELVCGSLLDDLRDIFTDLSVGIRLFESGLPNDACWHWCLLMDHWGRHVVDAVRPLHCLLNND